MGYTPGGVLRKRPRVIHIKDGVVCALFILFNNGSHVYVGICADGAGNGRH